MDFWQSAQCVFTVKAYYKNSNSWVRAQRAFRREFNLSSGDPVLPRQVTNIWVRNFEATASTTKKQASSVKKIAARQRLLNTHVKL